jgi:hypothetical protein
MNNGKNTEFATNPSNQVIFENKEPSCFLSKMVLIELAKVRRGGSNPPDVLRDKPTFPT